MTVENSCVFVGRLGADPIVRTTTAGDAVANFRMAINEKFGVDAQGNPREVTTWVNGVAWRKLAGVVESYVHKGDMIALQGRLRNRTWKDTDGNDRYMTEIVADSLKLLSPKPNGNGAAPKQEAQDLPPIAEIADSDIPF